MANKLKELLEKREKARKAAKAILDKAESENRATLSDDEKTEYKKRTDELDALDVAITEHKSLPDAERAFSDSSSRASGPVFVCSNGREVRGLRITDSLAEGADREESRISLHRCLRGIVLGDHSGQTEAERRVMSSQSGGAGGWLVPTVISSQVLDMARNKSVIMNAGALTLPMESGEMTIVKLVSDPEGTWRDENALIPESDATFAPLHLKAMSLACLVRVPLELLEDATMFSQTMENAIGQSLALELDRAALFGDGVGEPRGLYETPGLNELSYGANGGTPTNYDKFSQAVEEIQSANGEASSAVFAPRTWGTFDRMKDGVGQPAQPPESYKSLEKFVSNQIPVNLTQGSATNTSVAFVGDFSQLVVGLRKQITLEASREAGGAFERAQILIRGFMRADVAVLRPTHFTKIVGIKP